MRNEDMPKMSDEDAVKFLEAVSKKAFLNINTNEAKSDK